mmetsp:Transcript_36858/g.39951  ORF Transcript_36858/g.39951 Transcript_36858/m.39951 type:complete len:90 (+) Transcript_36858:677-946(+)
MRGVIFSTKTTSPTLSVGSMDRVGIKKSEVAKERTKNVLKIEAEAVNAPIAVAILYWRGEIKLGISFSLILTGQSRSRKAPKGYKGRTS